MALFARTIISRSPADILGHIEHLRPKLSNQPLLFTLSVSEHTDAADLSSLISAVRSLSEESVGCLSAPLPSASHSWKEFSSLSVASFDKRHATLFRSTIPGRQAAQVGRWHAMHQQKTRPDMTDYSGHVDWKSAMSQTFAFDDEMLPAPLQTLLKRQDVVKSVIYLSDNAPEGLSSVISGFKSASKLGLIATSTPFITGRPYTMFYNDDIYSDGAVGVCLSSTSRSSMSSDFPKLKAITGPMTVTSVEGNLINGLDNKNPSQLLLHAMVDPHISNTDTEQLYLGTFKRRGQLPKLNQLFPIASGDPSRGSLALDTDLAPSEGTMVQVFGSPSAQSSVLPDQTKYRASATNPRSLVFASISLEHPLLRDTITTIEEPQLPGTTWFEDVFLAASENGIMFNRARERPWKCVVPGSLMGIKWQGADDF